MKNIQAGGFNRPMHSEGTGLIIYDNVFYLFAISKPSYWNHQEDKVLISYSCVGGKLEKGEGLLEAGKREAYEELGIDVDIYSAKVTYLIDLNSKKRVIKFDHPIKPFAIYYTKFPGKVGDLSYKGFSMGRVYVYFATLLGEPQPLSEIPALLWLKWEDMLYNISNLMSYDDIVSKGRIKEGKKNSKKFVFLPNNDARDYRKSRFIFLYIINFF